MNIIEGERAIRVIIADDHSYIRSHLRRILERSGNITVVAEAKDGQEAVELLEKLRVDVVLLDVEMPKMTGLQVLEHIKEHKIRVAALMVSSYSDNEFVRCAIELGASGYIAKEDTPELLVKAVRAAVTNTRLPKAILSRTVQQALAI